MTPQEPEPRVRGRLHGGPHDRATFFPPADVVEAVLADDDGTFHLYRAGYVPEGPPERDGRPTLHMAYVGPAPDGWFDDVPTEDRP